MVMVAAYGVCGLQLVFITTHLPAYLAICGMDPMLSAEALAVTGIQRARQPVLRLGRWPLVETGAARHDLHLALAGPRRVFHAAATPAAPLIFAAIMGFLWLGVGPLIAGSVGEMFGLRWQVMIQGIAFMSQQLGSFLGAFGGGLLFDTLGSYDLARRLCVGLGLAAGIGQTLFALMWLPQLAAR
jgi:hypothetical protein